MKKYIPNAIAIIIALVIVALGYIYIIGKSVPQTNSSKSSEEVTKKTDGLNLDGVSIKGDPKASATILEFGDYQCVACVQFFKMVEPSIKEKFIDTGKANMGFKTLSFIDSYAQKNGSGESWLASKAVACAQENGKFWQMHDEIYLAEISELNANKEQENSGNLTEYFFIKSAKKIGLNENEFKTCLLSDKYSKTSDNFLKDANIALGGQVATPSVFIIKDGKATKLTNPFDISEYEAIIK